MTALGILGSGPVVAVGDAGTLQPRTGGWSLRWWVAGEDRWHRADRDPAVRQRQVDDLPLVETSVRVPGGDAVVVSYAFAGVGGAPEVVSRLTNESPVPIAAAVVIGPAQEIELIGDVVQVDGRPAVWLGRRPAGSVAATDLDQLAERVEGTSTLADGPLTGYVAFVAPLPHTQAFPAVILAGAASPSPVPSPEQVGAGWELQIDRGAGVSIPSPDMEALRRARADLVMGLAADVSLAAVAQRLAGVLRLGWFDEAVDPTERLIASQRGRGGFGDDETTQACVAALSAWRVAGVPGPRLEHIVGPIAAGAHRLRKRRRRVEPAHAASIDATLLEAAWCLEAADQPEAAREIHPAATAERPIGGGLAGILDGLVRETDDGIDLLAGWTPEWAGAPVEVTGLPTRWGHVSFAVRWHGARPAVLWEVAPWIDLDSSVPTITVGSIDPAWSTRAVSGEALLGVPAGAMPVTSVDPPVDPPVDGGFS